ncbi:bifunctional UDP-N-acetylglucosamine diphosphorylase/glucosamine-1-phosphate N-acetyltransferase GlmU [Wenzhouxiangella sp. XN79A]|uniref:bifunctional UDP-N-acetylglucosamine diphosphorylase/glucosamine-1-phosphate N-acetyltransferase GlmU n=1 Tax=Wenzhouxiangella sp. XN79A TaxID=2724193 RepID=UPI00144A6468|nr:bifunctional UDP-N-acetylglucosamine diphosphorylase/glucosamine-1-phosphate N-acetyltransferase GlmU [Wenzhouxiangella sp. XN79A]NKI35264.1 bifunctional UDP-N-acetylglucosamine diphosphorylase/glucosamine-1-phosphate N-acetyltransferase GlmU [Wenzhouxiangella sp. XN79A]
MTAELHIVVLAAGEGRRMNSDRPKVLQPLGGAPMLEHVLVAVDGLDPAAVHVVIGAGGDQVRAALETGMPERRWVEQHQRLGTGHAVEQALPGIPAGARVLVLPGDMPLVRTETLRPLIDATAPLALLGFRVDDPTGYGRILRDDTGRVVGIREERDASDAERVIGEVNSGVLIADRDRLADWLGRVGCDNAQGEYYLTDCIALAAADGSAVDAIVCADSDDVRGANDRAQLADLERVLQQRRRDALMAAGVSLPVPEAVQLRGPVECGRDVRIDAGVVLEGDNRLGDGVEIGPGCVLRDCRLAAGTRVAPYSVLEGAETTGACTIGPFARLRPGTVLAAGVKIGNFVETKNARFAEAAKASHLSYVGDAEVGEGANLGAGTITCNYDGANKHRTVIGAGAFVGSNSALVAPVTVGERATIGAGSVVSGDVPADALTVARARARSLPGWRRPTKKTGES